MLRSQLHKIYTHFLTLTQYHYLLQNLIVSNLKVRYKSSILGVFWSLLNPLLMMGVFTLVFSVMMPNNNLRQYPIFILVGLMPWNFFSGSIISGTVSITANKSLVTKVYFPRELLPIAAVLSNAINFLLAFIILLLFLYIYQIGLTVHALWFPVILLTQILFMLGLSFFLSALYVFYRDVMMILDVILLAWFFLTPVFYPFELLGNSTELLGITFNPAVVMRWINPMASIIDGYRTIFWGTSGSVGPASLDPAYMLRTFLTSFIIFVFGYLFFLKTDHLFGEKI